MSGIVSRAFILFKDARDKRFTCKKSTTKAKICTFLVKMVDICKKNFSPFSLYASNNLVHILLQLGTFHAHYTKHKN